MFYQALLMFVSFSWLMNKLGIQMEETVGRLKLYIQSRRQQISQPKLGYFLLIEYTR